MRNGNFNVFTILGMQTALNPYNKVWDVTIFIPISVLQIKKLKFRDDKLLKMTTNKQPQTGFWIQACFAHLNSNRFLHCPKHSSKKQKQTNKKRLRISNRN